MQLTVAEKLLLCGLVALVVALGVWLIWPDTQPIRLKPYAAQGQSRGHAQLTVNLPNTWQNQQLVFAENIRSGPVPKGRVVVWPITSETEAPFIDVLTPTTLLQIRNLESQPLTLSWVRWSNTHATPILASLVLASGEMRQVKWPDELSKPGQLWAVLAEQKVVVAGIYLPHDFFVVGRDAQKQFNLPNQSVRWCWLRYRCLAGLPLGMEVLITHHNILVNEGKPVTLSFETPLRVHP